MLNQKSGELLSFISQVAISARMNTAYNRISIGNPESSKAAMWLVDMLHNFHGIGNALSCGNYIEAVKEIDTLIIIWLNNKKDIEHSLSVNPHGHSWSVDQGINILKDLKKAVLAI